MSPSSKQGQPQETPIDEFMQALPKATYDHELSEIRVIVRSFKKRIPGEEEFAKALLELKFGKQSLAPLSCKGLTVHEVDRESARLCNHLDSALNAAKRIAGTSTARNLGAMKLSHQNLDFEKPLRSNHPTFDLLWMVDILETFKCWVHDNSASMQSMQITNKTVQDSHLMGTAIHCRLNGIKLSAATDSPFYKISAWLLNIDDPRHHIKRVRARFPEYQ